MSKSDFFRGALPTALSVGIFPYVLKLLQSSARELRPLLVFIWAKILSVDSSCQADLVKDNGHKYFLSVLSDPYMPAEHRTMAAFVLSMIVNEYRQGQEAALQGNLIALSLEQLCDLNSSLRQWLALCLGKVWTQFDNARWCGVRDIAHEKLYKLLEDDAPEVRAAAVFALGTFIACNTERTDHANNIDLSVGMTFSNIAQDGSPLVRKELVVAFSALVAQFESQFTAVAAQHLEDEKKKDKGAPVVAAETSASSSHLLGMAQSNSATSVDSCSSTDALRRNSSNSNLGYGCSTIYTNLWKTLLSLTADPNPQVREVVKYIVNSIKLKASTSAKPKPVIQNARVPHSAPSSPSNRASNHMGTPPNNGLDENIGIKRDFSSPGMQYSYSAQFSRSRKLFDKGPNGIDEPIIPEDTKNPLQFSISSTEFFQWCCKRFAEPVMRLSEEKDPESLSHHDRDFKFRRNCLIRDEAKDEQIKAGFNRLDDQVFVNKNQGIPTVIKFHPYESYIAVADKESIR
ncbi:RAPTOR [Mytilus edulis]|uniref:RAPTOR n=1 Tax=Mytilus edulis TaxID=6550 RepID=A0A8S3T4Z8_MYTED|nr:RAPTOR [Mytilus edulis]